MKPALPTSGFAAPLAAGLVALPFWIDAPLWGALGTLGAALWGYSAWRRALDARAPLPDFSPEASETFAPLDVSIAWRTPAGEFPTARRGWRAVLTESDLWLGPVRPSPLLGGDRDYLRIPRLDVVGGAMASETELRIRFVEEGRAQEVRLAHVPRAAALADALGLTEERGSRIV